MPLLTLRSAVIAVLSLSFLTFTVLFGRLPALRKTPIGFLHRLVWIYLPRYIVKLDDRFANGQLSRSTSWLMHYLLNEQHPLVMAFFIAILATSEFFFITSTWYRLAPIHHFVIPLVCCGPYYTLFLASMSDPGIVNTANHQDAMARYPYDYALFHPGVLCKTCELTKPARSKHCRICKHCIEKHDHHCAWVNNCLGYNNYHHFLLLLFSTGLLLVYGAYLSRGILSDDLHLVRSQDGVSLLRKDGIYVQPLEPFQKHWSANLGWSEYFALWRWAIIDDSYVGIVGLLCVLCAPLSWGLLIFHLYLTWAGMTTNESAKWSKWKDDIEDGLVFKAKRSRVTTGDAQDLSITASSAARSPDTASSRWPVCSDQILLFKEDGVDPGEATLDTEEDVASPWRRVFSLQEVDNLYDLGFWENLLDHFGAIHV